MGWNGVKNANKIAGVYAIEVVYENEVFVYIGQSTNIMSRWTGHMVDLLTDKHHSPRLQSLFNLVGVTNLSFRILEVVEKMPPKVLRSVLLTTERKHARTVPKRFLLNAKRL